MYNKFITVEGLDGSGKTTVISRIVKYLNKNHGITKILATHEPGGTPIADVLRVLVKYGLANEVISNVSELLMIYAARFQLLKNVIKPALSKGYWVIGDRYDLSSRAYQGGGREVNFSLLHILSKMVMDDVSPDLTLYLDVSPEVGLSRIKDRVVISDRIEKESLYFFNRVRCCYQELTGLTKKIVTINANPPLEKVMIVIYEYLDQWLLNI